MAQTRAMMKDVMALLSLGAGGMLLRTGCISSFSPLPKPAWRRLTVCAKPYAQSHLLWAVGSGAADHLPAPVSWALQLHTGAIWQEQSLG